MAESSAGASEEGISGINVTPLVDVSLVLVLIFMTVTPLSIIHGIDVRRHTLKEYGLSTPQENINVHLTARGIFIDNEKGEEQKVAYDQFGNVLTEMIQMSSGKLVSLKPDRNVPHGQTVWVMDLAKQNGAADISILESELMPMEDTPEGEPEDMYGINVTPLVDVSLVLVLIFMVTSPFFSKPLLPVNLPQAVASETEDHQNITVSISPVSGFAVNEVPIKKEALGGELREQMLTTGFSFVLIRADERVPHGEVQDVMKICKRLAVKRIAFATMPKVR